MKLEDYKIVRTISKSNARIVALASNQKTNAPFFITIYNLELIPQEIIDEIKSRAESAAQLKHKNIQEIYRSFESDNKFFVFSEYLSKHTLEDVLENSGAFQSEKAYRLIRNLGEAVHYAHSLGVAHGRINNRTVRFSASGIPKITGYDQSDRINLVSDNRDDIDEDILYSSFYQAPEVIQEQPVTAESDQYSLACIHYELLTGKTLFEARSVQDVLGKKFMRIQGLDVLNPEIQLSLIHALQPENSQRFSSVKEFLKNLYNAQTQNVEQREDYSSYYAAPAGYKASDTHQYQKTAQNARNQEPAQNARNQEPAQIAQYRGAAPNGRYEETSQNTRYQTSISGENKLKMRKQLISLLIALATVFFALLLFYLAKNKGWINRESTNIGSFTQVMPQNESQKTPQPVSIALPERYTETPTDTVIPTLTNTSTQVPMPTHANVKMLDDCRKPLPYDACLETWRSIGGQLTINFRAKGLDISDLYVNVNGDRHECSQGSNLDRFVCTGTKQPYNKTLIVSIHENGSNRMLGSTDYIFVYDTPTLTPTQTLVPPTRTRDKYGN
ncbi:MAG: protein kinase [Chloroflexi bacterium]|nr:protein kinase [Chloroflexota bacterium]